LRDREAEIGAMLDVADFIDKAHEIYGYDHFINDAGGSIVELDDPATTQTLAEHTLILYLRPDAEMEQQLVQRAIDDPKPLYFREDFLDAKLTKYLAETGLASPDEIVPDEFVRWIFPALVEHRRPLYEAMADQHGYVIDARQANSVSSEQEFLELVAAALD
jgi:hypothetical protein